MRALHVRDVPDHIYEALKAAAARDRRSMNAQIVEILDRALQADAVREQRLSALAWMAESRRRSIPDPDGVDSLTLLHEGRER